MNFPSFECSRSYYETHWSVYNQELYDLCQRRPGHDDYGAVVAKVGIIARAYQSGLERHGDKSIGGGILSAARVFHRNASQVDEMFNSLRKKWVDDGAVSQRVFEDSVLVHGRLIAWISAETRGNNVVRSFVSKYMHFHVPCVPIYDGLANTVLRRWFSLRSSSSDNWCLSWPVGDCDDACDYAYYKFVSRFVRLLRLMEAEGLEPSVKQVDQYLLYCRSEDGYLSERKAEK